MDWAKIRQIFEAALSMPPEQRALFVRSEVAGDAKAEAELLRMLHVNDAAPEFLGSPVARISDAPADDAPVRRLAHGEVINQRYSILEPIGSGGSSFVYLAADNHLAGRRVVVKVIRLGVDAAWMQRRFDKEIQALSTIEHPGVVSVLDRCVTADGTPCLVMQYVEGKSLRVMMAEQPGPWTASRATPLLLQIARALAAVHAEGICHRDVRPENILVRRPGRRDEQAVLIDFGIATAPRSGDATTRVTGTPEYMAPEQLLGRPVPASDVYSLGVIAFELLGGQRWHALLQRAELANGLDGVLPSYIPTPLRRVLLQSVARDADERFENSGAFANAIEHTRINETRAWRIPVAEGSTEPQPASARELSSQIESPPAASPFAQPVSASAEMPKSEAPERTSKDQEVGEFTRMFATPAAGSVTPSNASSSVPRPLGNETHEDSTGEFTRIFGVSGVSGVSRTTPPASLEDQQEIATTPEVVPTSDADRVGEFTRVFRTAPPADQSTKMASPIATEPSGSGGKTDTTGEFTRVFGTAPAGATPLDLSNTGRPQSTPTLPATLGNHEPAPPGEFTRIFATGSTQSENGGAPPQTSGTFPAGTPEVAKDAQPPDTDASSRSRVANGQNSESPAAPSREPGDFTREFGMASDPAAPQNSSDDLPWITSRQVPTPSRKIPAESDLTGVFKTPVPNEQTTNDSSAEMGDFTREFATPRTPSQPAATRNDDLPWIGSKPASQQPSRPTPGVFETDDPIFSDERWQSEQTGDIFQPGLQNRTTGASGTSGPGDYTRIISVSPPPAQSQPAAPAPHDAPTDKSRLKLGILLLIVIVITVVCIVWLFL